MTTLSKPSSFGSYSSLTSMVLITLSWCNLRMWVLKISATRQAVLAALPEALRMTVSALFSSPKRREAAYPMYLLAEPSPVILISFFSVCSLGLLTLVYLAWVECDILVIAIKLLEVQ